MNSLSIEERERKRERERKEKRQSLLIQLGNIVCYNIWFMLNPIWIEWAKLTFYSPLYAYMNVTLNFFLPCTHLFGGMKMKNKWPVELRLSESLDPNFTCPNSLAWINLGCDLCVLFMYVCVCVCERERERERERKKKKKKKKSGVEKCKR